MAKKTTKGDYNYVDEDAYVETDTTEVEPAQQELTGEEPPEAKPATVGASATNPDLMMNDPPDGTPLYDLPPGIPAYVPPPEGETPLVAYAYARGEPRDDHEAKLREMAAGPAPQAPL